MFRLIAADQGRKLESAVNTQLGINLLSMCFDCLLGNIQNLCNIGIGVTKTDQLCNLAFFFVSADSGSSDRIAEAVLSVSENANV